MRTFLEILAQNALAAALLGIIVLALMPVIRRPAARHALWLIVFARLLLPPLWSVPVLPEDVEKSPAQVIAQPAPTPSSIVPPRADGPVVEPAFIDVPPDFFVEEPPPPPFARPPEPPPIAVAAVARAVDQTTATSGVIAREPFAPWLAPTLFAAWLTGFAFVVVLAAMRIRRFERGLRDALAAPAAIQVEANRLAKQLGLKRSPAVLLAPGRVPPMLWMSGLFARRARLILPMELCFRLSAEQRSALMAHELAHLRRGDPWVRWLELLVVALYWWFPLVGFFRRRLRECEEQCCDGWVVALLSTRKAYATALLETVDYLDRPEQTAAPALASGASPVHNLQRRLTMIMSGSVRGRLTKFGALAVLGVAVGALAFSPAFSQQDQPRDKERKERGEGQNKERPRGEGEFQPRGKERGEPKRDGEFQPKGKERGEPREANEEIDRARAELQRAREEAERAMQRVRELEERFARLMGREGRPPRGEDPMGPGPAGPRPVGPAPRDPMGEGGFGRGGDRMQDLQRQIEEMRRMLEELRREIGRGTGGPNNTPKDRFDRKDFRPGGGFPGGPGGPGGFPGRPGRGPGNPGQPGDGPGEGGRGGEGGREKLPQPPVKDRDN